MLLDQEKLAQRYRSLVLVLAAYHWTLIHLSVSKMTVKDHVVSWPFVFISNTNSFYSRLSISSTAYVYSQPKHSHQRDPKASLPGQLLAR